MDFTSGLRDLVRRLDADDNAAYELWTWLPSYKVAQKHHGDYASNHQPPAADVMREAAMVFALQARPDSVTPAEQAEWFEQCPCGESHTEDGEDPTDNASAREKTSDNPSSNPQEKTP